MISIIISIIIVFTGALILFLTVTGEVKKVENFYRISKMHKMQNISNMQNKIHALKEEISILNHQYCVKKNDIKLLEFDWEKDLKEYQILMEKENKAFIIQQKSLIRGDYQSILSSDISKIIIQRIKEELSWRQ